MTLTDLGCELWSSAIVGDTKWGKRNKSPQSGVHGMLTMWEDDRYAFPSFVGLAYVGSMVGCCITHNYSTSLAVHPHDVKLSKSLTNR